MRSNRPQDISLRLMEKHLYFESGKALEQTAQRGWISFSGDFLNPSGCIPDLAEPALASRVWLDEHQRSLPTLTLLLFCETCTINTMHISGPGSWSAEGSGWEPSYFSGCLNLAQGISNTYLPLQDRKQYSVSSQLLWVYKCTHKMPTHLKLRAAFTVSFLESLAFSISWRKKTLIES